MPADFNKTESTLNFNVVIGLLEDMLVDDEFIGIQNVFMEKYWRCFDIGEENKLGYIDIFKEYQEYIENYIECYLRRSMEDFKMNEFISDLLLRKNELDGEIFEVLLTFTDFISFKEMFLDYKAMKEGLTLGLSEHLSVTKIN